MIIRIVCRSFSLRQSYLMSFLFLCSCTSNQDISFTANSAADFFLAKNDDSCLDLDFELKKACEDDLLHTKKQVQVVKNNEDLGILNALQYADTSDFEGKSISDNIFKKKVEDAKENLDLSQGNLQKSLCNEIRECVKRTARSVDIVKILTDCNLRIKILELEIKKNEQKFSLRKLNCQKEYLLFQLNTSAATSDLLSRENTTLTPSPSTPTSTPTPTPTIRAHPEDLGNSCQDQVPEFKSSENPMLRTQAVSFCGDQYTLYKHRAGKTPPARNRQEGTWYWIDSFAGSSAFANNPTTFFGTTSTQSIENVTWLVENHKLNENYKLGKFHVLCECKKK